MPRDKEDTDTYTRSITVDRVVKGKKYYKASIPPDPIRKLHGKDAPRFVPFVGLLTKDNILFFQEMPTQELRCPFCDTEIDPHQMNECSCGAEVSLTEAPDAVGVPNYEPVSGLVYPLLPDDAVDMIQGTGLVTVYFSR
ncbi:MAG: hypothetical protein GF309_02225 [Candidatus Lokiarchaeota archaeon]|nr:hypothetical protein [Candidatus Lokiarchaeota archaeon]